MIVHVDEFRPSGDEGKESTGAARYANVSHIRPNTPRAVIQRATLPMIVAVVLEIVLDIIMSRQQDGQQVSYHHG